MAKKVSSKSTKTEIFDAYQALETAYQQLSKAPPIAQAPPMVEPSKAPPEPAKEPVKEAVKEPVKKLSNVQAHMDMVIKGLAQLGEQFNTALSQLSTNLLVEAGHLKEVSNQVTAESQRLASLYNLTIEENTLSILLKNYTETAQLHEAQIKQKREQVEKAWAEKNQTWQQEKEETTQRLHERENFDKKNQKREDTEYHYEVTLKREFNEEEYAQQRKQQQNILEEMQKNYQKQWDEKEQALTEREKQFEEYKAKVERFPRDLEAALKRAKEEGMGIARHQAKIKADLLAKEFSGEEEFSLLKIRNLEEEVANQMKQIDKLSQQLEATLKQVQELAVKAIEGASSHSSFQALKEIALEQAKGQSKPK